MVEVDSQRVISKLAMRLASSEANTAVLEVQLEATTAQLAAVQEENRILRGDNNGSAPDGT